MPTSMRKFAGGCSVADRDQVLKERALVAEGWRAADWPGPSEAQLAAYLDREHPLPEAPAPSVVGTTGVRYVRRLSRSGLYTYVERNDETVPFLTADLPTVANLLCSFEEVVRAASEEWYARRPGGIGATSPRADAAFCRDHLPAILARIAK